MGANDTRRLRVVVTGESKSAQQAVEQIGSSAEKSQSKLVTLTKTVAGFAGKGALALGAVGAAAVTMGFSTATQLEQVTVGFTTMLGSAQKAQKFLKQLQQFANSTPFEFDDVTGAAQKFLSMGFAAKDIIPMLTAVGDAVAAMGGSAENIDSITTALSQMQVKGHVAGDEIMQLSEQGVPALQILADGFGVSVGEMQNMISKGSVLSSKAIPLIVKGLEDGTKHVKGFGGMMQAQSETMAGKWSTFMDTMKTGLGNIATIFLPMAKKAVDLLSKGFQNFFAGLQGQGALKGFSGTLNDIGLGLRAMIGAFKDGDVTSKGMVGTFEKVGVAAREVVDALLATVDATKQVVAWFREHDTVAKILVGTMTALYAITKAYSIVTAIQAAGGLMAMFKNLSLVMSVMKTLTAVQWAYNGATAAAKYLQIAGYLAAMATVQKLVAVWTKVVTAVQWAWNVAMDANPIGLIVAAIAVLVGAFVLLWKHNEGFRNFILNVLWPTIKKVWDAIKTAFTATINALVVGWHWLADNSVKVWNAIWGFIAPIVQKIIAVISPIINVITTLGRIFWGFYTAAWKIVWILVQIAVKLFVMYLQNVVWPIIKWFFNTVAGIVVWLYNTFWKPIWDAMKDVVGKFVGWLTNTALPFLRKVWDAIKLATKLLKDYVAARWDEITSKIRNAYNAIAGPIAAVLNKAINWVKDKINTFKLGWNIIWDGVRNKVSEVWKAISKSFNIGVDAVTKAWNSLKDKAKAPINFIVNDIYNDRIRTLWNKVAEKFGIKTRLDPIKGFARGGTVGKGYGTQDDQLAMLTRGEGILTTKEMRKLGGPTGFAEFRQSLAMYNKGGVVGGDGIGGWISNIASKGKDFIQGIAGQAIKPLVNVIRNMVNNGLPSDGFGGLMRGGANTILNSLVSWVAGKDKEGGAIGGGGGVGMGWQNQIKLLRSAFPGLTLISGFRPGARTLSGNRSYHAIGRAVDVPPIRAVAMWIRQHYGSSTKELITPWPELDLRNGRFHDYDRAIDAQHGVYGNNAHVHWAMDSASTVQPGWFTGYNGTGKPETLVNKDILGPSIQIDSVTIVLQGTGYTQQDVKNIRNELIKLGNRNGGSIGLPKR
jgi:tape measure domain-containing protein